MTRKQAAEAAAHAAARRRNADGNRDAERYAAGEPDEGAEPGAARAGAREPGQTEPEQTEPRQTEPAQAEPGQADPRQAESGQTDPGQTEPGWGEPGQPPADADGAHEREVAPDLDELAARAEKAEQYLVLAQRTKADFENYRKRASREAALAQERGIARLAKELLPAIDNLDRAVQAAEAAGANGVDLDNGESSQLVSGIKLVQADVMAALGRAGIEPFSPVGEAFDPQWHEAVAQLPVQGSEPGTVVEVYQQGYRLGETVLRPARVLVAG